MTHINDNTPVMETKEAGYNTAERATAYGDTVRIVYEVVAPSTGSSLNLTRTNVAADEDYLS